MHARDAIQDTTGVTAAPDIIVLVRLGSPADSPSAAVARRGLRDPSVAASALSPPARRSKDGRSTYLLAWFKHPGGGNVNAIQRRLGQEPYVSLGGGAFAVRQVGNQVSSDIARAELIAFPILFLLSLIVFRSAVSALLPLAVGGTSILARFLVVRIVNQFNGMSPYALNLVNGVGLGLAIDYSLFMVSRFREELANGATTEQAVSRTMRTAGRTVAFSGVTVAAALAALLIFRQRFLYSMGVGGAACALIAAAVSLTLLPALLGVLGERVNAGGPKRWKDAIRSEALAERSGFWYRHSRRVMRHPGPVAAGAATLLIALGLPFTGIRFTGVDASVLPRTQSARVVDDALKTEFPPERHGAGLRVRADRRPRRRRGVRPAAASARARDPAGRRRLRAGSCAGRRRHWASRPRTSYARCAPCRRRSRSPSAARRPRSWTSRSRCATISRSGSRSSRPRR